MIKLFSLILQPICFQIATEVFAYFQTCVLCDPVLLESVYYHLKKNLKMFQKKRMNLNHVEAWLPVTMVMAPSEYDQRLHPA